MRMLDTNETQIIHGGCFQTSNRPSWEESLSPVFTAISSTVSYALTQLFQGNAQEISTISNSFLSIGKSFGQFLDKKQSSHLLDAVSQLNTILQAFMSINMGLNTPVNH